MYSSKRCICLHVGLPKTGTKTLQKALFSAHSQLYYLGKHVRFRPIKKGCRSEDIYKVLLPVLWNVDKSYDIEDTTKIYQENILPEIPDDKLLLASWENLGNLTTEMHIEMLNRVQRIFGSCRIIYVLRNPITQLPSQYLQHVSGKFTRGGRSWMGKSAFLSFDAWFELLLNKCSLPRDFLNYSQNIKLSTELLGKDNVGVFLFEDMINNPEAYYHSISDFIGIDTDEVFFHLQQKHFHPRISEGQLDLIKKLDSNLLSQKLLPYFNQRWRLLLLNRMARKTGPAKAALSPELIKKISAVTKEGHHWLVDNLNLPLAKYNYPL